MSENDDSAKKLSTTQNKAIAALIDGSTQQAAADAAGVSAKTVWRWLHGDAAFAYELHTHASLAMHAARVQLASNLSTAVDTIVQIMIADKPARGSSTKLRAAKMIIDSAVSLAEFSDILERLEAIERKLSGGSQ